MKYEAYLTQASAEAKKELRKHFYMCKCCGFDDTIWLSAVSINGNITIHGVGYFDNDGLEGLIEKPSPERVCQFYVADALKHGNTVVLTPDVNEFINFINRYICK